MTGYTDAPASPEAIAKAVYAHRLSVVHSDADMRVSARVVSLMLEVQAFADVTDQQAADVAAGRDVVANIEAHDAEMRKMRVTLRVIRAFVEHHRGAGACSPFVIAYAEHAAAVLSARIDRAAEGMRAACQMEAMLS